MSALQLCPPGTFVLEQPDYTCAGPSLTLKSISHHHRGNIKAIQAWISEQVCS